MTELTQALVRELLDCDYRTGQLTWRKRGRHHFTSDRTYNSWNTRYAGQPAFNRQKGIGYKCGVFYGKEHLAHRIIFLHAHGYLPKEIDHINGNPADNRIVNLRAITHAENMKSQKKRIDNTSGITGVYKVRQRWRVRVVHNKKAYDLGYFKSKEAAEAAVIAKRKELGGFTERHGR